MRKTYLLLCIPLLLAPAFCSAQIATSGDVIINEIAWMGGSQSANDEWLELFNPTDKFISFSGWTLKTQDEKINIALEGGIEAQGFYLLERTDDNSVMGIGADLIYKGSLSNEGQWLKLYDSSNNLLDQANFSQKWPAGNSTTKQTMERVGGAWQTSKDPGGTPRITNSTGAVVVEKPKPVAAAPTPKQPEGITEEKPEAVAKPEIIIEKTYPSGIVINEIMPAPEGADDANEWIELYNTTTTPITVAGWKLQDTEGTQTKYTLEGAIAGYGYLLLTRPTTHITLNNDQDTLQLLWPNGKTTHTASYTKAKNQSFSRSASTWQWTTTPTPGAKNVITTASAKAKSKSLPATKKSGNTIDVASASLSNPVTDLFSQELDTANTTNPWIIFITAAAIAAVAGAILLAITFFKNKNLSVGE